jgi:hypothetical protein
MLSRYHSFFPADICSPRSRAKADSEAVYTGSRKVSKEIVRCVLTTMMPSKSQPLEIVPAFHTLMKSSVDVFSPVIARLANLS